MRLKRLRDWEEARDKFKEQEQRPDGTFQCFHCPKILTWEEAIVDHYPYTKGNRPDLLCDPSDFVISCADCNRSDNPNRKHAI